jgi:hypothetical protein
MKKVSIMKMLEQKCKIGMVLTLGDNVKTCVDTMETSYGTRYVFNDGIAWTISNIKSNIDLIEAKGGTWCLI